ncbi:MAG: serine--tRNA ligase [Flavobacteriaceae bacterium]|nr:serine--tRNA ligase [Flavobacteriaceae bacterium]|tara:strand:- start:1087 stop:2358 length:1272 start_codon:yes stop_codon:yes gene_type:complete
MLAIQFIRNNRDLIIEAQKKRNFNVEKIIDNIIKLDTLKRVKQTELENKLAKANIIAKEIGALYKAGDEKKVSYLKKESSALKTSTKIIQDKLTKIGNEILELRTKIPNIPNENVPHGESEKDNEEIFKSDIFINIPKNAIPHWELAKKYDIIDFDLGSKISGSGFPVYKNKGARLQRALINFFLDQNIYAGYNEYQVPHLVNSESGFGTGNLPDKEGQMYHVREDDLYLIPTAEVPLTNIYRNVLLKESDLPICVTGYTPCFRREAGSYGAQVRGLNRLHQFDKVEIVRLETPGKAINALEGMVEHVKKILSALELPYRILKLCGGDLGFTSSLTYDFEIFSAAQERWLEISSVSIFNDFQSQRLNLKYKTKQGVKQHVYTLNGSALALPRVVAGLLENFQTNEGIIIPKALIPYTGFDIIS